MADGQRCKANGSCTAQAVAWEYRTMGAPRVICRIHMLEALKKKNHVQMFWGEAEEAKAESQVKAFKKAVSPSEYREWARANGWQIGDRGRVSLEIKQAYHEEHHE